MRGRPDRRAWCCALAAALVLVLGGHAAADGPSSSWRAQQRLGAGYDGNPSLAAEPDLADPAAGELGERAVLASESELAARIGDAWWGGLSFDLDGRWFVDGSGAQPGAGRLDGALGVHGGLQRPFGALELTLEAGRYIASFGADDAWTVDPSLRGELTLTPALRAGLELGGGLRAYDAGQHDLSGRAALDLGLAIGPWRALVGLAIDRRTSDQALAERSELTPWVALGLELDDVALQLQYALFVRRFDEPDRNGVEHALRFDAVYALLPWLGPFLRVELGHAGGDADALAYTRFAALAGLSLQLSGRSGPTRPPRDEPWTHGPIRVDHGVAHVSVQLPGARSAAVIASWNGWDAERGRLSPTGDDRFEARFPLAPGRYRYHFVVDGQPRRPEGAPSYVRDDFGGEDAVLVVPP